MVSAFVFGLAGFSKFHWQEESFHEYGYRFETLVLERDNIAN